jgi:hypothetical protein
MPMLIPNFYPEVLISSEPTIQPDDGKRPGKKEFNYPPARFTERQENFYRNLLRMYRLLLSKTLPIYFETDDGKRLKMDRGCIMMAVHDGFLSRLEENLNGVVESVNLNW